MRSCLQAAWRTVRKKALALSATSIQVRRSVCELLLQSVGCMRPTAAEANPFGETEPETFQYQNEILHWLWQVAADSSAEVQRQAYSTLAAAPFSVLVSEFARDTDEQPANIHAEQQYQRRLLARLADKLMSHLCTDPLDGWDLLAGAAMSGEMHVLGSRHRVATAERQV